MLKIAHLADIHWRGLARHDEYRQVFDAFVDDAQFAEADVVFVGGDIFHTKTSGLSPEYIDEISRWMRELTRVGPTHLILGNHDGNLVNLNRQDAVTPIFDLVQKQGTENPLYLWKFSGVYDLAPGFKLCLFSIFDEENWDKVKPVPGYVNIAAYHGPVQGAKTETDWEVDGDVQLDLFEGFDFALLGDIHKKQFLGYRMIAGEEKPWIGYPGSTIQQNHSEDIEHGYLLWEIHSKNDWDVSFRALPNPRPFVTINWTGNKESTLDQIGKLRNARVRVKSDQHISQGDTQALTLDLKNAYGAVEVTYKSDAASISPLIQAEGALALQRDDLRNPEVVLELVKTFHKGASVSSSEWDTARDLIKHYLKQVTSGEDIVRNTKWSLRSLKWDNTFGYGAGNNINFDNLNGVTGIFGPNRAGKSSIPGTVMYTIFNSTDRGSIKNQHICNSRHPFCYGKAVINVDSVGYVVERQTTKHETKKGVEHATTALNVWRVESSGELTDLAGEQRTDTEKILRRLIGTADDFLLTGMSVQGEFDSFIKQGSTSRWKTLAKFLDLEIFGKMYELVKEDVKGFKAQLTNFPEKNWGELARLLKQRLKDCETSMNEKVSELQETNLQLHAAQQELTLLPNVAPVTQSQVDLKIKKRDKLQSDLDVLTQKIEVLQTKINEDKVKCSKIDDLLQQHDIDDLRRQTKSISDMRHKVSQYQHGFDRKETMLNSQKKSARLLTTVPCGDKFPTCKFIKDAHENKGKISEQEQLVADARQLLLEMQEKLEKLLEDKIEDRLEKLEKLQVRKNKLEVEILGKENDLFKRTQELERLQVDLDDLKKSIIEMEIALNDDKNAVAVSIRQRINKLEERVGVLDSERIALATRKGTIESDIAKLADEKRQRDEILKQMKVHELISIAFSQKGIPRAIIASQLPMINEEISRILNGITNYTVELDVADSTDRLDLYLNYGDSRRIVELGSGMEKMIGSVALRVALVNVSSLPRSDIFFIDEGFGSLDPLQVESCNRLLEQLKNYFKSVVIISHVDAIKDSVDNMLEITRQEKDSHVVYD